MASITKMSLSKKILYGAIVNLNGLITKEPVKLKPSEWDESTIWWDEEGNLDFQGPGLQVEGTVTRFASHKKKEVQIFIDGCVAIEVLLSNIIGGGS